jgi:hypothetical protein
LTGVQPLMPVLYEAGFVLVSSRGHEVSHTLSARVSCSRIFSGLLFSATFQNVA